MPYTWFQRAAWRTVRRCGEQGLVTLCMIYPKIFQVRAQCSVPVVSRLHLRHGSLRLFLTAQQAPAFEKSDVPRPCPLA